MAEFDLVPRDYRLRLALRQWLQRLGIFMAMVVAVNLSSGAALALAGNQLDSQIQALQTQQAMTAQQRVQLESLDARIGELHEQWQVLSALRSGVPAEQIFVTIDKAIADMDVWFGEWAFTRAGSAGDGTSATVNTGYFIVVPDGAEPVEAPAWQVRTHIRIKGQARDHGALSRFVRALFERARVDDVRVQRTSLRRYANASVVDFELAIVLDGGDA